MESDKIEILLEKYFEGETSIGEENELKDYFSSDKVASHLEQYQPMFGYFNKAKSETSVREIPIQSGKRRLAWLSIAASVAVMLGIGFAWFNNNQQQDLGTFDNPEVAMKETQKALALLSGNVNKGIESMQYVKTYENTKNKVFINN